MVGPMSWGEAVPLYLGAAVVGYLLGAIATVFWGQHADKTQERVWHFVLPASLASASFLAAGVVANPAVQFAALCAGTVGVTCAAPMFWAFPTRFLRASAAAGGIALINSVGNLAGFADFLIKVDKPSDLGNYSYEVSDTKLSRKAKAKFLVQLSFYSKLLAAVQGVAPTNSMPISPATTAPMEK